MDITNIEGFSLMVPMGRNPVYRELTAEAVNDLSIDFICEALTKDPYERNTIKKILISVTDDAETIEYRRDVFDDFLRFPKLREDLAALLVKLADLREIEKLQKDTEASSMWQLVNRLRDVDGYVDCITHIKETLESLDIQSEGLRTLRKSVQGIYNGSGFPVLKQDITETLEKARRLKSITLGVNLDSMLRPKTIGVLSLNDAPFTDSGILKRFMNFANNDSGLYHGTDISGFVSFHPSNPSTRRKRSLADMADNMTFDDNYMLTYGSATGSDPISNALRDVVTDILQRTVNEIKSMLRKYVNINGYSFTALMPEIIFYIRFAELCERIQAKNIPLCKSSLLPAEQRECRAEGIYNLKLAIKAANGEDIDIVTNEFRFDDSARIYILTGPNRGGKTTITQAVGLAFLLAQNGIYVPAERFEFSPCDNIFTHFPADENETVDLGRLGEESKRLSEIFKIATDRSLLLLNESLATTAVSEGLYLAKDVVKSMRYLGVRCIFNTHMHDLARDLDKLNASIEGDSVVESMVTGMDGSKRSFKVFILPPQGMSYARDIAERYGITFEKIKSSIDERKPQ